MSEVVERVTLDDLDPSDPSTPGGAIERLTVDALEPTGGDVEHQQQLTRVGFRLAGALLGVIIFVFLWVGVYAWSSYPPTLERLGRLYPDQPDKAVDAYNAMRTSWTNNVKDLLQILVVSLLIPLVATVIGYIFGRRETQNENEAQDGNQP